jgi:uncharacterized damage-inducible protein DinB
MEQLIHLLAYHDFANLKYLEVLQVNEVHKTKYLMSHLINAHTIWNNRILNKDVIIGTFDEHSVDELINLHQINMEHTSELVNKKSLNELITYRNLSGLVFTNSVYDIIYHIINHATYHRAQVAQLWSSNQIKVPSTDYIAFRRTL